LVYPLIKTPLYINLSQAHSYHIPIYERCDTICRKKFTVLLNAYGRTALRNFVIPARQTVGEDLVSSRLFYTQNM
jgi:hypothetical protein